jgi:hypothetical protein
LSEKSVRSTNEFSVSGMFFMEALMLMRPNSPDVDASHRVLGLRPN